MLYILIQFNNLFQYICLIKIAEYSQQKSGYYYDEKTRKQIQQQIKKQHNVILEQAKTPSQNLFQHFNFSQLDQQWQEEKQQIKMKSNRKEINLAIIIAEIKCMKVLIYNIFDKQSIVNFNENIQEEQNLDIIMVRSDYNSQQNLIKFWIIRQQAAKDILFQTYLKRAHKILKFCSCKEQLCNKSDFLWINEAEDILKTIINDFLL